jgi:PQQ-dependent catabolism-associated CXXCW motif protein
MKFALAAAVGWSLLFSPALRASDASIPEPKTYRTENYRAPTPSTLEGARVLSTLDAAALWRSGTAFFIDVMPQPPRPANLPTGTLWRDKPHFDISRSVWLPDTGYGELHFSMERYFQDGLERVSGGDRGKLLVFYCLKDCWMSWNAAKRAQSFGYTNIAWYPDGTDGWAAAGLPLEERKPVPRPGA